MKRSFFSWKIATVAMGIILVSLIVIFNVTSLFGKLEDVTDKVLSNQTITLEKYLLASSECDFSVNGWVENSQGLGSDLVLRLEEYYLTLSGSADENKIKMLSIRPDGLKFQTLDSGNLQISVNKLQSPGPAYKYFNANLECNNSFIQGLSYFIFFALAVSLIYLMIYVVQMIFKIFRSRL